MSKSLDRIKKSREDLVNKIIENMEKGYIFQRERWNSNLLKPHNEYSKAYYKGSNRLRLLYEEDRKGYNDSRWLTYKQIETINEGIKEEDKKLKIKKHEKGTLLEKWIWQEKQKIIDEETEEEKEIIVNLKRPIVRYFIVFNGEQIENMKPLKLQKMEETDITKTADTFINSSWCPIEEKIQAEAYYSPVDDKITLPPRESFKSDKAFLGVLLHEMSHSTGHEGRIERKIRNLFGSDDYAKEELRAELSSFFLLSDLGISDKETFQDNSNYLKSWIQVLKDDPNELFKAANEAEIMSEFLSDNYDKEVLVENKREEKTRINEFKLLAQKYNFKIRENKNSISICAKNTDNIWDKWILYNMNENSMAIVGNTDQCNFWFCDTRPDLTPDKLIEFTSDLNNILHPIGYNVELKTLIDPEDWQVIANVPDAYEDERYNEDKKRTIESIEEIGAGF